MQDLKQMMDTLTSSMNGLLSSANLTAEQTKMVHDIMHNGKSSLSLLSDAGLDNSELEKRIKEVEKLNEQNKEYFNILKDGLNNNK